MYPAISDFVNNIFGTSFDWPIMSYDYLLSLAFLQSALVVHKEHQGLIHAQNIETKPRKTNWFEFFLNLFLGFILAYKISFILLNFALFREDPHAILLSSKGYWLVGIFGAAGLGYVYLRQQKKQTNKQVIRFIRPWQHTAALILIAAVSSIIVAQIFHQLENWDTFIKDPVGELLSFDGLTFYGGLITAAFFVAWFGGKQKISWRHMGYAVASTLILTFAIGRIGCQVAGDSDRGIVNTAPMPEWLSFLPHGVWAYDYPNNVLGQGIAIPGCIGLIVIALPKPFSQHQFMKQQ
ncbi:MAG: hypothetical protein PWQ54_1347 [Bacteroidales bacterium]|nr:hypothetical protein [Bacteroidales bacterium]